MFVTTAGRTNEEMIGKAKDIAKILNLPYINRNKRTVLQLQAEYKQDCLVVGKERLELFSQQNHEPFFFHPSSANFRVKRLLKGQNDPLIEACELEEGMSFLDCTLGLGSDSIVASFVVGSKGKVLSLEANRMISYIVKTGLKNWDTGLRELNEAMSHIEVIHSEAYEYIKTLEDNSIDVIYLDPMFETHIEESKNLDPLMHFAYFEKVTTELIIECIRVAKKRVVLKDHYESSIFSKFDFKQLKRKSAKFHYGILELI